MALDYTLMPADVMVDIFKRLPAKIVCQCRCVCKSWNSLISSPLFIALHHSSIPATQKSCIVLERGMHAIEYVSCNHHSSLISAPSVRCLKLEDLPFRTNNNNHLKIIDAIHSVVCLTSLDHTIILWNPWIHKYFHIPNLPFVVDDDSVSKTTNIQHSHSLGFGFNASTNDFKLIRLWIDDNNNKPISPWYYQVFSVGGGVWRRKAVARNIPPGKVISQAGFFMNGAIHWILEKQKDSSHPDYQYYMLLMFDCERLEFTTMMLPPEFNPSGDQVLFQTKIFKSQGLLNVSAFFRKTRRLWVMEEYGVGFTWKKPFTTNFEKFDFFWLVSEESMFLMDVKSQAVSYAKKHDDDNDDKCWNVNKKVYYEIAGKSSENILI